MQGEPRDVLFDFFKKKANFVLVILFGSYARASQSEDSDIDIAFYCDKTFSIDDRLELADELQLLLKKPVDLIDLRDAHGSLLQEILVRGLVIKNEEPTVYERLIGRMLGEKEDDGRFLKKIVDLRLK